MTVETYPKATEGAKKIQNEGTKRAKTIEGKMLLVTVVASYVAG